MPDDFMAVDKRRAEEALTVDVDGFEGPLDLLLTLARTQKVDLRRISVLALAEQYLGFVERVKALRIELAADYLVMAAWLAFLKSRLLLPEPEDEGPSGQELAAHLAFQLERLEAMRRSAARLMARDQKGRDFFARGVPENVAVRRRVTYEANLLDLMQAYARLRTKGNFQPLHLQEREAVLTMEEALARLSGLIGQAVDWADLSAFLPEAWQDDPKRRRSALAATFAASLEMVKAGRMEIRQVETFAPIQLRSKEVKQ
ncbi:MAG: ScpA family protein [Pseudomonadota bacterium]